MKGSLLLLFVICIAFCSVAQTVKTSADAGTDPLKYTTFRVDRGDLVTLSDEKSDDDLRFFKMFKKGIELELKTKGFVPVEDSTAELVISYVGESIARTDNENLGPLGEKPASDGTQVDASRNWAREYTQNNLVIEVTDVLTKRMVWRATTTYTGSSLMDARTLDGIISKAFKKFPQLPKKKSK